MKQFISNIILFIGVLFILSSCRDDLLNQPSRNELPASAFWKTTNDAEYALNGAIGDIRYLFNRDYYLDGTGEYLYVRGNTLSSNRADLQGGVAFRGFYDLRPIGYGAQFDNMYRYCYGGINRANYVIEGVERMVEAEENPTIKANLESIIGEAKLLRSLVYLKLISMWGDVPYIDQRIYANAEVEHIARTPIAEIVPELIADLTYAYEKLPAKATTGGRLAKPAALALRGKVQLYWASWNRFGWPELDTFKPSSEEVDKAYRAAVTDFENVIDNFGLTLYRNGEPGECDELGNAEKLPNYYYLFTPLANGDPEFVLTFNFGGPGSGQSEELMRDFAGRSIEYSQVWVCPRFEIANRYQSIVTGDFCDPLIPISPSVPGARTMKNSAVNPQSYADRDYRMKASVLWDYEKCIGLSALKETGWVPYIYKTWGQPVTIDGVNYTSYETDGTNTGYVFRKFVRNYGGAARSEGDFNWPVIRLADVYLMYAEASNAVGGPQSKAIEMVNRVRHRGNLPPLAGDKTANADAFFSAIEQERIIELFGEGQRGFDLRRWRAIERVWAPMEDPEGVRLYDTWGNQTSQYFQNQSNVAYEQCYIFRIPPSERDRNPNLTQNKPFR
ncbi:MAG: RagB/SusD family nutrient uptake outer membrane protein [Dysgonamonadaceae bacterium]|jgi:hypothetical protein|nr:RagB/SusD family nutrient uptake outer membrane protein [Dysgonamonadaceae bacterium]